MKNTVDSANLELAFVGTFVGQETKLSGEWIIRGFFYELVNPVQKHSELFRKTNWMNLPQYFYFFFQAWKYTFIVLAKKRATSTIIFAFVFHRRCWFGAQETFIIISVENRCAT